MKMIYNGVPINSMKVKHYELNTNDCDMIASDLQAGKTAVARGKKITGTGKAFEFASYGFVYTNEPLIIPTTINVIEIASTNCPIQLKLELGQMKNINFNTIQSVANAIVDGVSYDISAEVTNGELVLACDKTFKLEVFYGKDNYV